MNAKIVIVPISVLFFLLIQSCEQKRNDGMKEEIINRNAPFYTNKLPLMSPRITKQYDSTKVEKLWPFIIYKDGTYLVAAEVEEDTILNRYSPLFKKYGADEGSGYSWAALLKVILKKENPDLIKHLDFDPETGGFYLFADSENSQREFAVFAAKAFNNKNKLIGYLTGPDKKQATEYDPKN